MPPLRPSALVIWHSRHLSTYSARRMKMSWRSRLRMPWLSTHQALGRVDARLEAEPGDRHIGGAGADEDDLDIADRLA